MKTKTILLYISVFVLLIFVSEGLNYLMDPRSRVSLVLNKHFIQKSVFYSKEYDYDNAIKNLMLASKINIYGEYGIKLKKVPNLDNISTIYQSDDDTKKIFMNYINGLIDADLKLAEDQGLGRIYYNLALIVSNSSNLKLSEELLRLAMYNNPQFASFHAELINYYYRGGDIDKVNEQMNYCLSFTEAKTLCEMYKDDSIKKGIPKDIGYMQEEVERHYLQQ